MTAPAPRPREGADRAPVRVVARAIAAMARPSQLLLIAAVMLLGAALTAARGAALEPVAIVVGLVALLPVAASIHLANEYADHETDRLTVRTPFSGGSGALPATGLARSIALRSAQAAALAGIAGSFAAWAVGLLPTPAVAVLLAGLVGGWAYSLGPFPLAWRGFGEVANGLLGGMLLPLYGVAAAGGMLDGFAVASFVPLTLLVTANLLATTWPDRLADAAVGKRTLATQWPPARLRSAFGLLAVVATAVLVVQGFTAWPALVVLAGLSAVPLLALGLTWYTRRESPLPTVAAMVWLVVAQLGAWIVVGQA